MSVNASRPYFEDDVCIVGAGSVLPGSVDNEKFFGNVLCGKSLVRELSTEGDGARFGFFRHFVSGDRAAEDKVYSTLGAALDPRMIEAVAIENGMDPATESYLDIAAVEAARQALSGVKVDGRAQVILGLMNSDGDLMGHQMEELRARIVNELGDRPGEGESGAASEILRVLDVFMKKIPPARSPWLPYLLPTALLARLKSRFKIRGPGLFVDAACASSLAAIKVSIERLRAGETDFVLTGGVESNLSVGTFLVFCKVGAMAPGPGRSLPFDGRSKGITQGEGAVLFGLQRLGDALKAGNPVLAVLRSCGGSSDGRSSSLFQPTVEGQLLAFERAYSEAGGDRVDYVEGHGTGTEVGDRTELQSLSRYFKDAEIPVGSVKAILGHTKGAAGAASLLKCVMSIRERVVPPSPYFASFPESVQGRLFVNREPRRLRAAGEPLRMGISSFGFGGTNFHLVVEEYRRDVGLTARPHKEPAVVVACAESRVGSGELDGILARTSVRVPPRSLPHIDRCQLLALVAVDQLLRSARIRIDAIDRSRVSVLSASTTGLDSYFNVGRRLSVNALREIAGPDLRGAEARDLFDGLCDGLLARWPRTTEDTGSGNLNNVIAGRVCNFFDFKGMNFNVDADFASFACAVEIARLHLSRSGGMAVVVGIEDSLPSDDARNVERRGARALVLASRDYAEEFNLPVARIVEAAEYRE